VTFRFLSSRGEARRQKVKSSFIDKVYVWKKGITSPFTHVQKFLDQKTDNWRHGLSEINDL